MPTTPHTAEAEAALEALAVMLPGIRTLTAAADRADFLIDDCGLADDVSGSLGDLMGSFAALVERIGDAIRSRLPMRDAA